MDTKIIHPFDATDIPFSATGLSIGIVEEPADEETLRLLLSEVLTLAARLTMRCRQYEEIVGELRAELRARRAA